MDRDGRSASPSSGCSRRLAASAMLFSLAGLLACTVDAPRSLAPNAAGPADARGGLGSVAAPLIFSSLSAGRYSSCGVAVGGKAYCWGQEEVGDSTHNGSRRPVAVVGGLSFASVSHGGSHACGVTVQGAAYCWGANYLGQLGIGTTQGPGRCPTIGGTYGCSTYPVPVLGGLTFTALALGDRRSCGLTVTGDAYCWGETVNGVRKVPERVGGGHIFTSIAAGAFHDCAVTAAGAAYCWGWNDDGQLGVGSTTGPQRCTGHSCSILPVPTTGGLLLSEVTGGAYHTCGISAPAGTVYCWGANLSGQLGNGNVYNNSPAPVAIAGGASWTSVEAGYYHTCALTKRSGAAYCWGYNAGGQLGDGTTTDSPSPVAVIGGHVFAALSRGDGYLHMCALTLTGRAFCWGSNSWGQLGAGDPILLSLRPVAVAAP